MDNGRGQGARSLKSICFTITHKKAQVRNSEKTITRSSKSTAPFAISYSDVSW